MFCVSCGTKIPAKASFCPGCGAKIAAVGSVVVYGAINQADVLGRHVRGVNPTELYTEAVAIILKEHPEIIGRKETHFTASVAKANEYTGTTKQSTAGGHKVYIKTGFSTNDKWKGLKAICDLAGISFSLQ